MYKKKSEKDWVSAAVTAGLGAGVVTSFAVSQGQNPLLALSITAFAIVATLLLDQVL
jgi:energy-converting hydrogenase Eha subunit G